MKATGSKFSINGTLFLCHLLQEPFGSTEGGKSLYSNNSYLYKRTTLDVPKCEISR